MMYLKSLYLTLRAVKYKPVPNAAKKASTINKGRKIICHEGRYWYQIIISNSKANEIPKSTKLVITELAGMIMRGKYTLLIRFEFPIKLLLASLKALLKNCQGNMPAKTIRA